VASAKAAVVVDMTLVDFIASVGMRLLLKNAKAQAGRGGKLVLFNPTPTVRNALMVAGISEIIPLHEDFAEACSDALAGTAS
jgi:anti-sigma B factor antagonist